MTRKKKDLPILENVTITDVAAEGKALTRVNDMVVFVPFAVPGDIVDLQVRRKKHSYCEATILRMVKESPIRVKPACRHFGICGGCKWQNLPYNEQLKAKQKQVEDQLKRIGKVELPPCRPILGSEKTLGYRNKLEFGCCNRRWFTKEELANDNLVIDGQNKNGIGFHITGAFDKIYPIEECLLMDGLQNNIRNEIRDFALAHNYSFYDIRQQTGLLRDIVIRCSNSGEWMVIIQFCMKEDGDEARAHALLDDLASKFPQITSLLYVDNQKGNDTFGDLPVKVYKGADHIFLLMDDLKFKVGPKSFYQTNTDQARRLYGVARELAGLTGKELVYDLYTGTGTIANFVARSARKVIGIEYVADAIEDAKENSRINGIDNTLFYAGDMKDILTPAFIKEHGHPDVIITDPPRAGMYQGVVQTIMEAAPERIVYVSCNPATQARDLSLLDSAYRVEAVQPVDMFPQTPHVENVVLLKRR